MGTVTLEFDFSEERRDFEMAYYGADAFAAIHNVRDLIRNARKHTEISPEADKAFQSILDILADTLSDVPDL